MESSPCPRLAMEHFLSYNLPALLNLSGISHSTIKPLPLERRYYASEYDLPSSTAETGSLSSKTGAQSGPSAGDTSIFGSGSSQEEIVVK